MLAASPPPTPPHLLAASIEASSLHTPSMSPAPGAPAAVPPPPPVPPRRRRGLFGRKDEPPDAAQATATASASPASSAPTASPSKSRLKTLFADGRGALGHGFPSTAGKQRAVTTPALATPSVNLDEPQPALHLQPRTSSMRHASSPARPIASSSRVKLDVPPPPPTPPPKTRRDFLGQSLALASRSTPNLSAAAKRDKNKAATAGTEAPRKKSRVSLGMLFQTKASRSVSAPVPNDEPPPRPSAPTTPLTPTFYTSRCASCEALDTGSATTPRALSRPPSLSAIRPLSRPSSHSALRASHAHDPPPSSLRGPPNALYNSVYRHASSSMSALSPISPGLTLSQTSLNHSRTSLNNVSRTDLSLSQTSLVLPDARNQLLSKDHYHLRFAATYIINLLTPALRTANFSKSERNLEIKRITEDRLAILQRMERTWGSSWSEAAAELLNGTQSGVSLEVQEAKLRACNITATAKARERKVFVNSLRDGIILCFLFNRLFPAQPAHIQRVKVPKDDTRIKANVDRFLAACRETGVPESEMFTLADLDENSPCGLACVARNILVLAQMSGPTQPRGRIASRIPMRSSENVSTLEAKATGGLNISRLPMRSSDSLTSRLAMRSTDSLTPRLAMRSTDSLTTRLAMRSTDSLTSRLAMRSNDSPVPPPPLPLAQSSTPGSPRLAASLRGSGPVPPRALGERRLRSSSSDLVARMQREGSGAGTNGAGTSNAGTSSGAGTMSSLNSLSSGPAASVATSAPPSSVAASATSVQTSVLASAPTPTSTQSPALSASNTVTATPPTPRLSSTYSLTPPLSPVRSFGPSSARQAVHSPPLPSRPQTRAAVNKAQVSFAGDAPQTRDVPQTTPQARDTPPQAEWSGGSMSSQSTNLLSPVQERDMALQYRERTPSLVSSSSHVPSSYSRSSVTGIAVPTITADADEMSLPMETTASSQMSPETRRMSEQTLQEARRKIIGTLLTSTEDLTLQSVPDDARGLALSQSLAALEGSTRPPLKTSRSDSPRLRPVARGSRQSIEMHDRLDEESHSDGARPVSDLPPRPRIRRPSVNGKVYIPKRPQSPASASVTHLPTASTTSLLENGDYSNRTVPKEERRRSEDYPGRGASAINATKIMNMRNHSMVNLPSKRASTLTHGPRDVSAFQQSLQVLEFKESGQNIRYQLGNCIGRGQFGSVYRSLNLTTGQMVAIKRIRLSGMKEKEVRDVMREVELLKRLTHPGIVKYEGMSRDDQFLNIVLEFVENGSLGQTLKAFGKFNERLVASYVAKILEGLHYLHSEGVVHCDLKAANILSTKNGNIKLTDFGVSLNMRAVENFAERASIGRADLKGNEIAGTPNWMAPEIIKLAGASPASDIWSLGCTIIELVTGKPPYWDVPNSMTVLFRIVEDPMPPMPPATPELTDFLKLCFIKDPKERPPASLLWEHEWVRSGRGEPIARPQDSLPFLRRLSQEPAHHRVDAQRMFAPGLLQARSASASLIDLHTKPILPAQESVLSLHSQHDGEPAPVRTHSLVKTSFGKPITCHICLQSVKKSALLCQNCGLIIHSKCADRTHPRCDVREQLALLALHQDWNGSAADLPRANGSPYGAAPTTSLSSLPARIFGRNRSKASLLASTSSLVDRSPPAPPGRRSSSGAAGTSPQTPLPPLPNGTSALDGLGSLRSRHSETSEDGSATAHRDPRSTSLIRIDEDGPAHGYRSGAPAARVHYDTTVVERKMPPAVEGPAPKRRSSGGFRRRSEGKECVIM